MVEQVAVNYCYVGSNPAGVAYYVLVAQWQSNCLLSKWPLVRIQSGTQTIERCAQSGGLTVTSLMLF